MRGQVLGRAPGRALILALLSASVLSLPALGESLMGSASEGRELAREVCSACHRVEKDEGGTSEAGAPAFQDVADDPAVTESALRVFFRTPHESMPNLVLTEPETDNVVAYILSLK